MSSKEIFLSKATQQVEIQSIQTHLKHEKAMKNISIGDYVLDFIINSFLYSPAINKQKSTILSQVIKKCLYSILKIKMSE